MRYRRPVSATSPWTSLAGVAATFTALALLRDVALPQHLKGLAVVAATAVAMILVDHLCFRTDLRPSSGLLPRATNPISLGRVARKLIGFWVTIGALYAAYQVLPEYLDRFYGAVWTTARDGAPWLAALSPFYIFYVDRRQADPEDAYAQLGGMVFGRIQELDYGLLGQHARGWIVKGFFLPLMFIYLLNSLETWWNFDFSTFGSSFDNVFQLADNSFFLFDLLFAVVGYSFTLRVLDSHIRSTEPTFFGWAVCIACYQPVWTLFEKHYFFYEQDNFAWGDLTHDWPVLHIVWGMAILFCLFVYSLSTVMFGLRFSNLTHRGIIAGGPYRWTKHPAYLSKCLSFWLVSIPFFPDLGWEAALEQSLLLAAANGLYVARAITEERHLSFDPDYRAYQEFIRRHGLFAKVRRLLLLFPTPPARGAENSP